MLRGSMNRLFARAFHSNCHEPVLILQEASRLRSIKECKQLHAKLLASGLICQTHLANTLLHLYSRFGGLDDARLLFDQMPNRNVVSWTTVISAYTHHVHYGLALGLFKEMLRTHEKPNQFTLSVAIRTCTYFGVFELGLQIHGLVVRLGFENDEFSGSSLVYMYSKTGVCIDDACQVFSGLFSRDIIMWNVMISTFAQVGDSSNVSELLYEMRSVDGLNPNDYTFASLLKCCGSVRQVEHIHGLAVKTGIEFNNVVAGSLVDTYCKCGQLDSGKKHLYLTQMKDCFIWSSIISGYARNGLVDEAILLFKDMCGHGMLPDQHALSGALKACAERRDLQIGEQLHTQSVKCGYHRNCIVSSVLLTLYAECGLSSNAKLLFDRIDGKDLVAWNSMLLCYAELTSNSAYASIMLFREFCQSTMLKPDGATFIALLKSCQSDEDLLVGTQIHARTVKSVHNSNTTIGNAMIHMYSMCDRVDDAYKAFDEIDCKDDISWSSMISCYQQHRFETQVLSLCKEMLAHGISLTTYSLPSSVAACSRLAAIHVGQQFHSLMVKSGFHGDVYIGSSFIDMYSKCGNMEDALNFFHEQENPIEVTFNALISGFAQHGKVQEAIKTFHEMEKKRIAPNQITFLALLTACSHGGRLEDGLQFFTMMVQKYNINPETEHLSCLVDLFGRAGRLEEALEIIEVDGGPSAWRTLLSASKNYDNHDIAELSAERLVEMNPRDHASYVLLSNLFAGGGKWKEAFRVRKQMESFGIKKDPGSSWLINRDEVHRFLVGDFSHVEMEMILDVLSNLYRHMQKQSG
ncbi:hypothetical protein V2J09_009949 [Rumex salicifolius]